MAQRGLDLPYPLTAGQWRASGGRARNPTPRPAGSSHPRIAQAQPTAPAPALNELLENAEEASHRQATALTNSTVRVPRNIRVVSPTT